MNLRLSARAIDLPIEVLPTPGGPTKQRIGSAHVVGQLVHREVLEHALLDLLEPVVVLVEDLLRFDEVELLVVVGLPRQADEPVEVGADDAGLGRRLRHLLEPAELLERLLGDLLGHAGRGDLVLVLVDLGLHLVELAELLLDRLELLAQEVLALRSWTSTP